MASPRKLGLTRYVLFLQDYGGPIGFRLALAHPERVQALIVQNAVAHEDGLGPLWEARRQFWAHRAEHETTYARTSSRPPRPPASHRNKPYAENYDPITRPMVPLPHRPAKPTSRQTCSSITGRTSRAIRVAGVASGPSAAAAGDLGSLRSVLRGRRGCRLPARRARRRGAPARRRPLRPRRPSRPDRRPHPPLPRRQARRHPGRVVRDRSDLSSGNPCCEPPRSRTRPKTGRNHLRSFTA